MPARSDDDRAPVLGGVAGYGDDDGGDEELGQVGVSGEGVDGADNGLRHERRHDRRGGEGGERERKRPAVDLAGRSETCRRR